MERVENVTAPHTRRSLFKSGPLWLATLGSLGLSVFGKTNPELVLAQNNCYPPEFGESTYAHQNGQTDHYTYLSRGQMIIWWGGRIEIEGMPYGSGSVSQISDTSVNIVIMGALAKIDSLHFKTLPGPSGWRGDFSSQSEEEDIIQDFRNAAHEQFIRAQSSGYCVAGCRSVATTILEFGAARGQGDRQNMTVPVLLRRPTTWTQVR